MFDLFTSLPPKPGSDGSKSDSVTTSGIPAELEPLLLEGSDHDGRLEAAVDEAGDLLELLMPPVWFGVIVLEEPSLAAPSLLLITTDGSGIL